MQDIPIAYKQDKVLRLLKPYSKASTMKQNTNSPLRPTEATTVL